MYSVVILKNGICYATLSCHNKTVWKTKRTANKHCESFNTVNYVEGFRAVVWDNSYPVHSIQVHLESELYSQLK